MPRYEAYQHAYEISTLSLRPFSKFQETLLFAVNAILVASNTTSRSIRHILLHLMSCFVLQRPPYLYLTPPPPCRLGLRSVSVVNLHV